MIQHVSSDIVYIIIHDDAMNIKLYFNLCISAAQVTVLLCWHAITLLDL